MIQMQTRLVVADNSGAKEVMCIKILGGSKRFIGGIGCKIVVSVKIARPRSKVSKGDVLKAVVVRTKKSIFRKDGVIIKFSDNAVVLINDQEQLIGTRIVGPIAREIKYTRFSKIVSFASEVF